ncbi:NMT1/THI5 like family protein [Paraburkholderia xenovorans LB400]|uniref:ABC nitrate/sulfonate/bicarbonate family transporter, periplasmic ligand binding protein n=1 Tax=Paraburkholderia xenovorans (strain LB400) TaxID=266265 RepID=Q13GV8_PARXL|nr:ABC transporter substrate-binding protein [Paraburkholderia xenovorans]ABE36681.1 ABC nitrate/sulfonate/bicarbonate family transporter, periplasmic ligand binding protein [Paraburkholderia xenovorans LB400]AIP34283.1 NMT1/THI5 like family protein [Paraburkholderia xenovorans LB400]
MQAVSRSRRAMLLAGAAALAGAPFIGNARAQGAEKLVYQTGWLPQPDKGGLYQALATGLYRQAGLDVEIRPGSAQMNVNALFLAGRADFADSDSFRVLNFVRQGLPAVAVAAFGQRSPHALASHAGTGADTLAALKGKPILVSAIGRQSYWLWLKARYGYTDDQLRPYTGSLAPFLADRSLATECFVTSDPYEMQRAGANVNVQLLADHGFRNYYGVMVTHPQLVADKPDVVQRFVDATIKGWQSYLHGDPGPANALIRQGNPEMTDAKLAYCHDALRKYGIVASGDADTLGLGAMTDARWKGFYDDMVAAQAMPPGLDVRRGYTLQFINHRVGLG